VLVEAVVLVVYGLLAGRVCGLAARPAFAPGPTTSAEGLLVGAGLGLARQSDPA